jgi:hypothetical protein
MSDPMICDCCGAIGRRRMMMTAPEGWLWTELATNSDDPTDTLIVVVCSQECATRLWRDKPERLDASRSVRIPSRDEPPRLRPEEAPEPSPYFHAVKAAHLSALVMERERINLPVSQDDVRMFAIRAHEVATMAEMAEGVPVCPADAVLSNPDQNVQPDPSCGKCAFLRDADDPDCICHLIQADDGSPL